MKLCKRSWACSATAALVFLAGCGDKGTDELIASARKRLGSNEPTYAIVELKSALKQQPDSPEARFLLGQALLRTNNPAEAAVEFRKAVTLRYPAASVVPALVQALVAANENRKVVDEFGQLDLPEPLAEATLKTAVGRAYATLSKRDLAASSANAALKAVPEHAPALLLLARLEAAAGRLGQAQALIQRAEKVAPKDPEVWVYKGDLAVAENGDSRAATQFYEKALALDDSNTAARGNLASLLIQKGDLKAAEAHVVRLRKTNGNSGQTVFLSAQLALAQGDLQQASDYMQQILKVVPDNVNALQLAGRIGAASGSLDIAERSFAKALSLVSTLPDARRQLAVVYLRRGNPERALATLAPLIREDSSDAAGLGIAAEAQMALGRHAEAKELFGRVVKIHPQDMRSRTKEALAEMAIGNTDLAVTQLREIADRDTGTLADLALVNAAIGAKDFDRALHSLDAIESKHPGQASTFALRGRVQLLMNHPAEAEKSFERALSISPAYLPAAVVLAQLDLAKKHPEAARKRFEDVLVADPKNLGAMLALASLLADQGAPNAEIVSLLNKAIKSNSGEAAPRLILIEHYMRIKDLRAAQSAALEADAALPNNGDIVDILGRAQAAAGDREQAILTFQRLTALEATHSIRGPMRLAGVYLSANQYGQAAESFRRALLSLPDSLAAQQGLLETLLADRRAGEALTFARSVQQRRPDDVNGYLFEGRVHIYRSAFAKALEVYRTALKRFPSTEVATKVHSTLVAAGQTDDMIKFDAQWMAQNPKDFAFIAFIGDSAMARKDFALAEKYFRDFLELQPDNPRALNNVAWLMLQQHKTGAVAFAEKADRLRGSSPELMDTLALTLAADKQLDKALAVQKRAVEIAPSNSTLRLTLAKLYMQAGRPDPAKSELDALAKLGSNFPQQAEVKRLLSLL